MRIGVGEDLFGLSTRRFEIIAETTDGRYVLRAAPIEMTRPWDGSKYLAGPVTGLFLRDKKDIEEVAP